MTALLFADLIERQAFLDSLIPSIRASFQRHYDAGRTFPDAYALAVVEHGGLIPSALPGRSADTPRPTKMFRTGQQVRWMWRGIQVRFEAVGKVGKVHPDGRAEVELEPDGYWRQTPYRETFSPSDPAVVILAEPEPSRDEMPSLFGGGGLL